MALSVISSGSPGPTPTPISLPAAHNPGLAKALIAAAVMALPPMRPRTMRNGTPRELAASASFDSAAPTNPTGMPRIAAGFGAPASSISSRRNSAVGALPMATTAPASRSIHSSSAAAERVVPVLRGERWHARIVQRADDFVARRQPRTGDAVRHHLGVAQDRRAGGIARSAPPRRDRHRIRSAARPRHSAGVDHAHRDIGLFGRKAREIGLGADDGERALIDRAAVAQIGRTFRHDRLAFGCPGIQLGDLPVAVHLPATSRTDCHGRAVGNEAHHPAWSDNVRSAAPDERSP